VDRAILVMRRLQHVISNPHDLLRCGVILFRSYDDVDSTTWVVVELYTTVYGPRWTLSLCYSSADAPTENRVRDAQGLHRVEDEENLLRYKAV
jgi:hypothetical protein